MQEKELRTLHKENYKVPKGEEKVVHYKYEHIIMAEDGEYLSHQVLCKTPTKQFDMVLHNLQLQGYLVEILYHPLGKYTNVTIPLPKSLEIEELKKEKDAEIEKLKAELAKQEKKVKKGDK